MLINVMNEIYINAETIIPINLFENENDAF